MRVVAILAILAVIAFVAVEARALTERDSQKAFTAFVKQYNKNYAHDEFFNRYNIFKANSAFIATHNKSNSTYVMKMNEFGDLTFSEFHARFTGYKARDNAVLRSKNGPKHASHKRAVDSVDWTTQNAVTPVKNQGQCGSCWSFSTTGSLEGGYAIANKQLVSFSEQQLVDCSGPEGDQGCNGGLMDDAFQFVITNKGICKEEDYPYTSGGGQSGTCQTTCTNVPNSAPTEFTDVTVGSEDALLTAVTQQPVSIAIEADQQGFQFYGGGVFDGACGQELDHGVLAVGFGTDSASGKKFWKVKNSWGASWGEAGYIRLVRGINQCGLTNAASYPDFSKSH